MSKRLSLRKIRKPNITGASLKESEQKKPSPNRHSTVTQPSVNRQSSQLTVSQPSVNLS